MSFRRTGIFVFVILVIVASGVFYLGNSQAREQRSSFDCYVSDVAFPPSDPEANPPLPPLNDHPYEPGEYTCMDFVWDFCQEFKEQNPFGGCKFFNFDHHAIAFIDYYDLSGQHWICFVEPQTNEYSCMTEEDFMQLDLENWTNNLCRNVYELPQEECDEPFGFLSMCEDVVGDSCWWDSPPMLCSIGPGVENVVSPVCSCRGVYPHMNCVWTLPKRVSVPLRGSEGVHIA